ncbi:MAG: hypothetical protein AAF138_08870 [Planctomycetota bacterium]
MRWVKRLVLLGFVGIFLLLIAGIGVMVFIDRIAKEAIERGGTYAMGVPVTVASADVGVLSGRFGLTQLEVANPQGFAPEPFLALGDGGVEASLGTLRSEAIELPEFTLSGVDLRIERTAAGANYQKILDQLQRFESGEPPADTAPETDPDADEGPRVVIRKVVIEDVTVHFDVVPLNLPAMAKELVTTQAVVDRIELTDLGAEECGVPLSQALAIIAKALMSVAAETAGDLGLTGIGGDLTGRLSDLDSLAGFDVDAVLNAESLSEAAAALPADVRDRAGSAVRDAVNDALEDAGVGEEAREALEGLGRDLLGGGRNDNEDEQDGS